MNAFLTQALRDAHLRRPHGEDAATPALLDDTPELDALAIAGKAGLVVAGAAKVADALKGDDVLALKSQAILKEMLGTTGGGLGNLELARSLDATDWPPLSRVARYFGYRGDLPQLD